MIERGEDLCFTFEASEAIRIKGERVREDLERNIAIQLEIARAIDLAHPAGAEGGEDLVRTESRASGKSHLSLLAPTRHALPQYVEEVCHQ